MCVSSKIMPKLFCWAVISYQQFSHFANLLFIRELNSIIRWLNWLWNCSMRKKVGVKCQAINWNITLAMSEVIRKQIKNHTPTRNYQLEKNHSSIIMSKLDWKTPLEIISNWIFLFVCFFCLVQVITLAELFFLSSVLLLLKWTPKYWSKKRWSHKGV